MLKLGQILTFNQCGKPITAIPLLLVLLIILLQKANSLNLLPV